ncbi:hypothetical protein [Zavarzinella formosa]|uniref:hypothetical protein n=1 Tax=Zavarzinella formosa TaxID=360055 RepID=UPI0002F902B6|nr:hypothetical protein [Zavarzinella formosa]
MARRKNKPAPPLEKPPIKPGRPTEERKNYLKSVGWLCLIAAVLWVLQAKPWWDDRPVRVVNRPEPSLEEELVRAAEEINRHLPMMVDKDTRADSMGVLPSRRIVYNFTLVDFKREAGFDAEAFAAAARPELQNMYRTNPKYAYFRDKGVRITFRYSDDNGVFLTEIGIDPR